jgi:transcriptional regulator with XRE-family HTH domain
MPLSSKDRTVNTPTFSEQLKEAIIKSELSRYEISKRTGLDQGSLANFLKGYRGLSMRSLDLLIDVLELEVRPRQERKDD